MTEGTKTLAFCCVAGVTVVAALLVSRKNAEVTAESQVGTPFVEIADPLAVTSLKIVRFDDSTGQLEPFEVTKTKSGYTIPSHGNYPADAQKHLAEAATSVSSLEILARAGDNRAAHEDFGVVDPNDPNLKSGAVGVGTRVTLSDAGGHPLADFIIGKKAQGPPGRCYVRHAEKDQVYTVKLDPQFLSTHFEDWIEKDLLKIDPLDLTQVVLKDYAVVTEERGILGNGKLETIPVPVDVNDRSLIELSYNDKDLKWGLDKLQVFKDRKPTEVKLASDEELNSQRLDDLKTALDDLKIADVRRKPVAAQGDLAQFIEKNPDDLKTMMQRGFYPLAVPQLLSTKKKFEILSDQGEVLARMNNGVEYVLRFGNVTGGQKDKVLRYLFVTTRFNQNTIPKPDLEKVPPAETETKPPADAKQPAAGAKEEKPSKEAKPTDKAPAEDTKGGGAKKDEAKQGRLDPAGRKKVSATLTAFKDPEKAEGKDGAAKSGETPAADTKEEAKDAAKENKDGPPTGSPDKPAKDAAEVPPAEPAPADVEKPNTEPGTDAAGDNDAAKGKDAEAGDAPIKKLDPKQQAEVRKLMRERIIKSNERKQKQYDEQVAEGKKQVESLNKRFAEWYYLISDDTYKKIHLGQKDVIHKKPPKDDKAPGPGAANFPMIPGLGPPPGGGAP